MRRLALAALCALALCALALCALALLAPRAATAAPRGEGRVLVMRIEGAISPVSDEALDAAIDRAERERYAALVVELDTPGGLESSMRSMVKRMLASEAPVIVWVTPSGAHAASAGVFVTMAADVAAMSPGTNIGAATPINMQGAMDSTLARKATNDASAFARTVAAQRGRNAVWAERAVREAIAASETEAVSERVVDFVARDLDDLLARSEGREWRRNEEARTLHVKGLPRDRIEPDFRQKLLALITDPNVAYILLMLGFYGIMFELQNPGAVLPGIVGGISLVLAFLALSTLPVNAAGIALIVLAVVFFLAEVKVASHGMLSAGGVLALVLGSMILFQGETARLSWIVIAGVTVTTALFFLLVVGAGLRAQRRPVTGGRAGLKGQHARAAQRLAPDGFVEVEGELWRAVADRAIEAGTEVEITGVEGLTLRVRPLGQEARP